MVYILDACYSIHADSYSITTLKKTQNQQYYFSYECNKNIVTGHSDSLKASIMHLITYDILLGTEAPQAYHLGQIMFKAKLFCEEETDYLEFSLSNQCSFRGLKLGQEHPNAEF